MLATCIYMQHPNLLLQHPDKTLATYIWNRWNIWNIHLKHTCIANTTCATSRCTFATSIYNTCNIALKHLKQLKHTLTTCAFSLLLGWMEAHRHGAWCRGVSGDTSGQVAAWPQRTILVLLPAVVRAGAACASDEAARVAVEPYRRGPHLPRREALGAGVPAASASSC